MNPEELLKKSQERIKLLKSGGAILCPDCKKGSIRRVNNFIFSCDNCGKGIVLTSVDMRNKIMPA